MEIISNGNAYSTKVWLPATRRARYIGSRHQGWVVRALRTVVPHVSLENLSGLLLALALVAPRMITYLLVYPCCRLVFGTLYPAYASYKAVRAKNLKEYVKWMMYWIVFALFTCAETFTDVFLSWFPFYYEVKIVLVMWLLSPATGGSSILYRKFVHPALCRREQEIDEYISKAKEQGYHTVLNLGTKGVNYATTVIMQTAIKNLNLANLNEHQERVGRAMLRERSETDSPNSSYYGDTDFDFASSPLHERERTPKIVEIESNTEMEYEENHGEKETASTSSARSRGYVKKRDVIKKPRSKSGGRKTRSKTAKENNNAEIVVNEVLHVY